MQSQDHKIGTYFSLHGMNIYHPPPPQRIIMRRPHFVKKTPLKKRKKDKNTKPVIREQRGEAYYDQLYEKNLSYKADESYQKIWIGGLTLCLQEDMLYVIDLGCGPGHFAKVLQDNHKGILKYWGYDISQVALKMAQHRVHHDNRFSFEKADLLHIDFTERKPTKKVLYTAYEFLEHINDDINIIHHIPVGSLFSFSVPNFWCDGHVRIFQSERDVRDRYDEFFDYLHINQLRYQRNNKDIIWFFCYGKIKNLPNT